MRNPAVLGVGCIDIFFLPIKAQIMMILEKKRSVDTTCLLLNSHFLVVFFFFLVISIKVWFNKVNLDSRFMQSLAAVLL